MSKVIVSVNATRDGLENAIEAAYWIFDRYKTGQMPMSERDAFKKAVRDLFMEVEGDASVVTVGGVPSQG